MKKNQTIIAAVISAVFLEGKAFAQNIAINTTGAAASSTNMLEVTQSSSAANMVALYAIHNAATAAGVAGYGLQAIKTGATGNNIAGYFSASGGGNNYGIIVPSGGGKVGIGTSAPGYLLETAGDIYANGGWLRVSGNSGLYFESWGGGWYMVDGTWIRSYNSKNVYIDQFLRADNGIASGAIASLGAGTIHASSWIRGNGFQDYNGNTVIDQGGGWHRSYGATGWYNGTYGGGWYMTDASWVRNYNAKPIYITGDGTYGGVFMSGRVGIGTATPSYLLHVTGSDANRTAYFENTSTTGKAIRAFNTAASGGGSGMGGSFESAQTGFSPCCIAAAAVGAWGMHSAGGAVNGGGLIASNLPGLFLQAPNSTGAGITNIGVRYGIYSFQDDYDALGTVTNGTGYSIGTTYASILANHYTPGGAGTGGQYRFGVHGASSTGGEVRVGGVLGSRPAGGAWCSLGYYSSGATSYACYGTTAAYTSGAGRLNGASGNSIPAQAGIASGFYGGVLGGWTRGNVYGMNVKGERYAMYVDGKTYTNDVIAQLSSSAGARDRIITYVPTSTSVDVYAKGTATLLQGRTFVKFEANYRNSISVEAPIIVTVTPMGKSNGVYIESVSAEGFTVVENDEGRSNVQLSWIAIGTKKGFENPANPAELLSPDYDANMNEVLFNENNLQGAGKTMWWDGEKLRFDALPDFLREKPEPEYIKPKLAVKDYDHDYQGLLKAKWQKAEK